MLMSNSNLIFYSNFSNVYVCRFAGNVSLFQNIYFLFIALQWIALQDRLFFYGPNVKDTMRNCVWPEEIQSSCKKLLHMDFHLTIRENRKATEMAESFMRQD